SIAGQGIDLNFKSQLQTGAITWMYFATTLTQFPIGIAVAALSFAILPSISGDAAYGRMAEYKDTLALGIRLVLFLTVPAAVGYIVLGAPIVRLLFQHGHFVSADTVQTSSALAGYALQIPFVGLDQLLIFAFYARKNTVTPMLVGVVAVGIYVVSAQLLLPHLHVFGLALANSLQNSLHGLILLALMLAAVGSFRGHGIASSLVRTCAAGAVMAAGAGAVLTLIHPANSAPAATELIDLFIPATIGLGLYLGAAAALGSAELRFAVNLARRISV
ncbi:MAG TPA: lipid II flippase MurJ, partial [Chloroflexota bacterium]